MFRIKLIKEYPFKVVVRGYSKINSLVVNVVSKPYKMYANLKMYLKSKASVVSTPKIVIDRIKLITKQKLDTNNECVKIVAKICSKEKINSDIERNSIILNVIKSKEKMYSVITRKSKMVLSPVVGYFKKLYEFDNRSLQDLDNMSMRDMDYEMMLMVSNDNEEEVI